MKFSSQAAWLLFLAVLYSCKPEAPVSYTNSLEHRSSDDYRVPHIEIYNEAAKSIISAKAKIDTLAGGFDWTEGPLYVSDGNYLLFSDIPKNKVFKLTANGSVQEYLHPSGYTGSMERGGEPGSNALILNPDGELVLCQHGDRKIAKMDASLNAPKPSYTTLAGTYNGQKFNSPNDAVYHPNGDLYFTDPPFGLVDLLDDPLKELDYQGVYLLRKSGQVELLTKEIKFPNGIALSNDQKTLYVANSDSQDAFWMAYDLDNNGLIQKSRKFYDATQDAKKHKGSPDGMKINKAGIIFATGPGGIWIFNDKSEVLARIFTGQLTSNCSLSDDEKYLFMTADDFILGVQLL